jgi:hypothetical protein
MEADIGTLIRSIRPLVEQAREKNGGILTEQMIEEQVSVFEAFPPFVEIFSVYGKEKIVKDLMEIYTTWIGESRTLKDKKHKAWLSNKKSMIEWKYWERYTEYLKKKGWPEKVVGALDKTTDDTLGLLEDPARTNENDPWDRRGMVVGHVQSGKTANYTGLICKAVDAGYKVIIVLAGMHNSLRSQTQFRLDEGVLGYDSTRSFDPSARTPIGVGLIPIKTNFKVDSVTNWQDSGDFSKPRANAFNIHLHQAMNPLLLVIKKNASVLRNLLEWLNSIAAQNDSEGNRYISGIPLLVIDDEADQGSIDTNKMKKDIYGDPDPEHNPTTLNRNIRKLLKHFSHSAYVGYTATPFANIFIHDKVSQKSVHGEDLFPRSFITNLSAPANYFGPVRVFGLNEDNDIGQEEVKGLPVIRTREVEKDAYQWLSFPHRKDTVPLYEGERKVPHSLRKAIRSFVLTTAARRARKQFKEHNSMLIHVTRFNDVQMHVYEQVLEEMNLISSHIKRNTDTYRSIIGPELKNLWESDFVPTTAAIDDTECPVMKWEELEPHLIHTVQSIIVKTVNGTTGDILEYEQSKETGLNVIAIGGDKLSRGLTLEGLSVSYFTRSSSAPMYDTLMQMGRWFGYRTGYYDLCRLYTSRDISEWFRHIASASEELRKEFDHMTAIGATPEEYGAKVRSHPTLLVTSKLKMRDGTKILISFSNYLAETRLLSFDEKIVKNNFDVACGLLQKLEKPDASSRYLFRGVSKEIILDFLSSYKENAKDAADTLKLAEYIRKQNINGNLIEWTVYFPTGDGKVYSVLPSIENFRLVQRQWGRGLYDKENEENNKSERLNAEALVLNHLITADHEFVDIDKKVLDKAREKYSKEKESGSKASLASFVRSERNPKNGLLLVYLIDPEYIADRHPSKPMAGFAISFPQIGNDTKVEYVVNSVFKEQETD